MGLPLQPGMWAGQVHLSTSAVDQGKLKPLGSLIPQAEGTTGLSFLWSAFLQVGSCLPKALSSGGPQEHSSLGLSLGSHREPSR